MTIGAEALLPRVATEGLATPTPALYRLRTKDAFTGGVHAAQPSSVSLKRQPEVILGFVCFLLELLHQLIEPNNRNWSHKTTIAQKNKIRDFCFLKNIKQ